MEEGQKKTGERMQRKGKEKSGEQGEKIWSVCELGGEIKDKSLRIESMEDKKIQHGRKDNF